MIATLALLLCSPVAPVGTSAPTACVAPQEKSTREQFVALFQAGDDQGCAALWRAHPYEVLYTIDEDLEGALATWEKSPDKPDEAAIAERHKRALWGAKIASEVFEHTIFLDYASAFAGQNKDQHAHFRAGQRTHGESRKALKAKDFATAQAKARECIEHASPLGDWWGHAMGLGALGAALAADGKHAEAIAPLGQAALIYHDLKLVGDEYGTLRALAASLTATGATQRTKSVLTRAQALAGLVGDEKGAVEIGEQLGKLAK